MAMLSDLLGEDLGAYRIEYRTHATRRMFERGLFNEDIERVLVEGEIIEDYEEQSPFHHLLLNGKARFGLPVHVVVVVDTSTKTLSIITTYEPNLLKWTANFTRRR
jgi:hypothetical protein